MAAKARLVVNQGGTDINASTYSAATVKIKNIGTADIAQVAINLATAGVKDLVFDPADGTPAGDTVGRGLTINNGGGTGVIFPANPNGSPPFWGPNQAGYNQLIINFGGNGFNPGETLAFSVDIDPTSIQGQTGSGSAGSVSGLELAGATFRVRYENGAVWNGQIFGDGSLAGGEAYAWGGLAGALKLNVGAIDNGEKGIVTGINQTLKISGGPPGATVRVQVIEGIAGQVSPNPPTDLNDPVFGANSAGAVKFLSTVLDGSGKGSVALASALKAGTDARYYVSAVVTKEHDGGAEHFEAAGLVSQPVIFKVKPAGAAAAVAPTTEDDLQQAAAVDLPIAPVEAIQAVGPEAKARLVINQNGSNIDASTYNSATIKITNLGTTDITQIGINLATAGIKDFVFDPADGTPAGDTLGRGVTINTAGGTGVIVPADPNGSPPFWGPNQDGYNQLIINFGGDGFNPGETLAFSVDIDPTSIQGQTGSGSAGSVSGLELSGALFKASFENGASLKGQVFGDTSAAGGEAYLQAGLAGVLKLNVGSIDNGEKGSVTGVDQTLQISGGPAGAAIRVQVIEGIVGQVSPSPPTDLGDPAFGANSAGGVTYLDAVLDGSGKAAVNLASALEFGTDARYHISAVVVADIDATLPGLEAAGAVSLPAQRRPATMQAGCRRSPQDRRDPTPSSPDRPRSSDGRRAWAWCSGLRPAAAVGGW